MKEQWFFLSNVFRVLANRSLKRFFKFCYELMMHLKSNADDPFFMDKYNQLLPYYNAFDDAYKEKFGNASQRKGDTRKLNLLLKEMSGSKIHAWDIAIQSHFINSTPEYTKIFPQGLSPLSLLSIEQRLLYLKTSIEIMSNYTQLSLVYDDMKLFYDALCQARNTQTEKNANLTLSRAEVMQHAYKLSNEIYGVLGEFMTKYKDNPLVIETYFPVNLLRKKQSATK